VASIELPDDEQFMVEGVITAMTPVGGGHDFAPPQTQIVVVGQAINITRQPCDLCGLNFEQRDSGPFGKGSFVVVSWLEAHGHYVVRTAPNPGLPPAA